MSDDTEILLMKIERQVGRICKALEDKTKDDANEQYLREHIITYLDRNFPSWRDNLAAQAWFDNYIEGSSTWNYGRTDGDIIKVPSDAARSIFELGWRSAMTTLRSKVQP